MADFISRDKAVFYLEETAEGLHGTPLWAKFALHLADDFKEFPAADVAPVRHGYWEQVDDTKCKCSVCDVITYIAQYPIGANKNYCPNCGAKMDGDTNGS